MTPFEIRRRSMKLTQGALAEKVGVSKQQVSFWELARNKPSANYVDALARAFKMTTEKLVRLIDENERAVKSEQDRQPAPAK